MRLLVFPSGQGFFFSLSIIYNSAPKVRSLFFLIVIDLSISVHDDDSSEDESERTGFIDKRKAMRKEMMLTSHIFPAFFIK